MNVLLALSHSVEEYDQLRLLHSLGYTVASIGGYIDPAHPHTAMRPPLPDVPAVPELRAAVDALGTDDNLGAAQSRLPDVALEWADIIIYHHYLGRLFGQWPCIRDWMDGGRRVVWRTVGQSVEGNEREAAPFRAQGLEIVRYSPKEQNIPGYCGEDALIRFYKDPADFPAWTGEDAVVVNVTQHLYQRSLGEDGAPRGSKEWTNYTYWQEATEGLPRRPLGPGSDAIGGPGELATDVMYAELARARAYLYTGTQPASYTLGLIEAMMVGVPVVSIGPKWMDIFPYGSELFEGHELNLYGKGFDDPADARRVLRAHLDNGSDYAGAVFYLNQRDKALALFGRDVIGAQWKAFLG